MNNEFCMDTKITYPKDCGNAPKKNTLINFYKAFVSNDEKFILENTKDELSWNIIGNMIINNKDKVVSSLKNFRDKNIKEIQIKNVITHGSTGAVNGTIILDDKSCFAFCDVYNFTGAGKNAKVKEISSYVIKILNL